MFFIMLRRRHRLVIVLTLVFVVLLYQSLQNSWDIQQPKPAVVGQPLKPADVPASESDEPPVPATSVSVNFDGKEKPKVDHVAQNVNDDKAVGVEAPISQPGHIGAGSDEKKKLSGTDANGHFNVGTSPDFESTIESGNGKQPDQKQDMPFQQTPIISDDTLPYQDTPTKIHWRKRKESFPLPKGSIITLPTGPAKKIPKIQHTFPPELESPKNKRLHRQTIVKKEIQRSWAGYRKYAWMHDELTPVSNRSRDPFCGWSATLVDSLDTLWIAGLKSEFDEAAKAAKNIDFTYTDQHSIPVFETTIRYLGGLIAAYDVSGGAAGGYSFLLDKAVELAEVLMDIFDTPNRMPILYYSWAIDSKSHPRRASKGGMAELATLSMEFTRLAQATGQHKYYDAVDRITNGLVDMQKNGTLIPGLFPENLDISGCNMTATIERKQMSQTAKSQLESADISREPEGNDETSSKSRTSLDDGLERRDSMSIQEDDVDAALFIGKDQRHQLRRKSHISADNDEFVWDCVPQGFTPTGFGPQKFHMGGGQDSAYEYFGKEYLLLGGREAKYQKLYEDSVEGINKHLLYRPMIPGDWDILFPAAVSLSTSEYFKANVRYEVTHLTCFIGGMYALGGKLFGREKDLQYAEKLTNGCVWAYQSTESGIMPENAYVVPCPTLERCSFNETTWRQTLDPMYAIRDQQVLQWEENERGRQKALLREAERQNSEMVTDGEVGDTENPEVTDKLRSATSSPISSSDSENISSLEKRAAIPVAPSESTSETTEDTDEKFNPAAEKATSNDSGVSQAIKAQSSGTGVVLPTLKEEYHSRPPVPDVPKFDASYGGRPERPPTHQEYVQSEINRGIPPGYSAIMSANYILRPEAIESVWYMYRITGDSSWMEKGWTMFEATMRATRTYTANSAIDNVLSKEPRPHDKMESFWLAETLKYYYLLFSEPDVISLDEWVLNTEAHPFKL